MQQMHTELRHPNDFFVVCFANSFLKREQNLITSRKGFYKTKVQKKSNCSQFPSKKNVLKVQLGHKMRIISLSKSRTGKTNVKIVHTSEGKNCGNVVEVIISMAKVPFANLFPTASLFFILEIFRIAKIVE